MYAAQSDLKHTFSKKNTVNLKRTALFFILLMRLTVTYGHPKTIQDSTETVLNRRINMDNACVDVSFSSPYSEFENFGLRIIDRIDYSIDKYNFPETAALKVMPGHNGHYSGAEKARERCGYLKNANALHERVSTSLTAAFKRPATTNTPYNTVAYAEGGMGMIIRLRLRSPPE